MGIKEKIESNLKTAMKAQDENQKRVFRMALAAIKFAEKEKGSAIDEETSQSIIQKEIKIRNEMIEDAKKADRLDTIPEIEDEIKLLETFLPKQLSPDELEKIVRETIAEVQASSPSDMGKVMKSVLPKVKGVATNDAVSKTVRELLANA